MIDPLESAKPALKVGVIPSKRVLDFGFDSRSPRALVDGSSPTSEAWFLNINVFESNSGIGFLSRGVSHPGAVFSGNYFNLYSSHYSIDKDDTY